jgi:hypothetical protein
VRAKRDIRLAHQAHRPNEIWVLDFMSDVLETGRRFRVQEALAEVGSIV